MHKYLAYAAFGWLTVSGALHFAIDVVSQFARGKRLPGPETTLYYGLNTTYALGQVLFGLLGLIVAHSAVELLGRWPALSLSALATVAWLAIGFAYIEYREPKIMVGIFGTLLLAFAITS